MGVVDAKLQSVADTYSQLLDTQLATQQTYYASLFEKEVQRHEQLVRHIDSFDLVMPLRE